MARDTVTLALVLEGLREFVSGTKQASGAIEGTGTATETAGKKAKISAGHLLAWGGGAAAAYGAVRFLKGSTDQVTELAKATYGLQKQTNLDTTTASAWVGVLKERGISTDQFRMSLTKVSKQMYAAEHGSKSAVQTFKDLGISQKLVASGNVEAVLEATANGLQRMRDHSVRAADAQTMLGRSGGKLLPLLTGGAKAIREQLRLQERYHNVLTGKSLKDTRDLIARQREMNAAYEGVKLQLGIALLPALLAVSKVILKVVDALEPLLKHGKLLTGVIIALAAAFTAYQIAMVTATIVTTFFTVAAGPVVLIVLGITAGLILLGIAIYEVIKHWKFFKRVLTDVWNWIKKNWPLLLPILLGPFGVVVMLIIKNFGKIKDAVTGLVHTIRHAFQSLWDWVKGIPGKLGGVASSILHKIPGYGLASGAAHGLGGVASALNPFGQHGGTVVRGGHIMVGEAGPELVTLPAGSFITPNYALAGGRGLQVVVPVYLDKHEIARAIGQVTADKLARR